MTIAVTQRIRKLFFRQDHVSLDDHTRGAERNRRAVLTGSVTTLARAVQIGTSLITVPLTLKYLGNERFGLWMTISSVLAMAAFADFGVGNGVLNAVAKAFGRDDMKGVRKAISSGFALLSSIATLLLLSFFAVYHLINWADFFRVTSPQARSEAGPALTVFAVCFALNISIDVVQRAQLGLQQGYRYGLWQLSGSIVGFIGVLSGIWLHVSLPVLVIALAGAPVFATLANAIHFFGFVHPDLRPSHQYLSRAVIVQIARLGGLFFVLQLAVSVSYSSDNIVLTRILGPLAVAQYAVPSKLFSLIAVVCALITTPLWPAYAEALERRDHFWIRRTLYRSLTLATGVSVVLSLFLVLSAPWIIHLWVGPRIHPSISLLVALGIMSVTFSVSSTVAMFLNGLSIMLFQVIIAFLGSIANIVTSVYLTRKIGIPGVVWGSILAQSFIVLIPYYWYVRRFFKNNLHEPLLTELRHQRIASQKPV